jgi:aspartate kinase
MAQAIGIVRQASADWPRVVVIASALSGVTNLLLDTTARAEQGDVSGLAEARQKIHDGHAAIAESLIANSARRARVMKEVDELAAGFEDRCRAISVLGEASPRVMDYIGSLGERMSVRIMAAALESAGTAAEYVEASELIVTDDHFQNAHPDIKATTRKTRAALRPLLRRSVVPVITGFMGATPDGVVTTLGRGGSDYSAAIIGAVLPADDVWIWTDVNGVMSADPRVVPEARTIAQISYREVAELAYYGAKVLHPKTIRPVIEAGIGLRICNTFQPEHPGTRLIADPVNGNGNGAVAKRAPRDVIQAVTAIRKQRLITIEGRGMLGVPGVAARAFGAVASTGTSVPLITQASSEQSICFAVPSEVAHTVVNALQLTFAEEIKDRDIDRIWATPDAAIITIVGRGVKETPGVAGHNFTYLGDAGINVLAIAQGSSEVAISLVVETADADKAVQVLHKLIIPA